MKPIRIALVCCTALLLASPALAGLKGSNLFAIQLTNGTADLYDPSQPSSKYISAYDHSEIGAQAEVWHFMSDEYATTVSVGMGMFAETDKPGNNPPASDKDFKYTQSSFSVRIGGDRVVAIGDHSLIYFGPGIEYWSGKSKFDTGTAATTYESGNTTRISWSGRMGGIMKLNDAVGLGGHIGHKLGMASATDLGRRASWWASSFDAAGGVYFGFGK